LQSRSTLTALAILADRELLPEAVTRDLRSNYLYLRHLEHVLQAQEDQQTQVLPVDVGCRQRVVRAMGYHEWEELVKDLGQRRQRVHSIFRDVVSPTTPEGDSQGYAEFSDCWLGLLDTPMDWLKEQGYVDVAALWGRLSALASSRILHGISALARERLDTFMPMLLKWALQVPDPDLAVTRVLPLVESVLQRTVYLVMLSESPARLMRLLEIAVASPWIAEELARYPVLLDELLSTPTLTNSPSLASYRDELQQMLLRLPEQDLESSMQVLRLFQKGRVLQVAAADVNGQLPLMQVSDALTHIAEAVLDAVLDLAWRDLVARHGYPGQHEDRSYFMVVAYGKLGGLELGYGSDLDLVFIHDGDEQAMTTGSFPLDQASFFARLGQKMIHILTASMAEGRLYEVDMRLRPSGHSGLLVTSLHAFKRYQEQAAWLWEHQALVRARPVAGDEQLAAAFVVLRQEILCRARDQGTLAQEVAGMREKMHRMGQHAHQGMYPHQFYIKHDAGGIVDIEFMVQYGVLAWAHNYPELTRFTDNVRILEGFVTQDLLAAEDVDVLRRAYMAYRQRMHRLALAQGPDWVAVEEFGDLPDKVRQLWAKLIVSV
ncbi:MAG: bifunctional [glutamate--ammonia ligase]-adenylyl-L-tyrosine phosphorylase/[glutamate--ammonia-ligase] adenylyltransferase, partial [Pseudomonadales bacterium]|nr:bifunctional [glutamate--ammonia ligase]-adenylyl-L-tyrosine phosphorylase/[glutamate--ammonia-ligase] adenylyltransferase [Pseudomonadales bacterium]